MKALESYSKNEAKSCISVEGKLQCSAVSHRQRHYAFLSCFSVTFSLNCSLASILIKGILSQSRGCYK